jgi:cyclophilin family peptidyl-prolyl cis-trans isomerase
MSDKLRLVVLSQTQSAVEIQ